MIELYYEISGDGIALYELTNGKGKLITIADDREELLMYIEQNYSYANLIINGVI